MFLNYLKACAIASVSTLCFGCKAKIDAAGTSTNNAAEEVNHQEVVVDIEKVLETVPVQQQVEPTAKKMLEVLFLNSEYSILVRANSPIETIFSVSNLENDAHAEILISTVEGADCKADSLSFQKQGDSYGEGSNQKFSMVSNESGTSISVCIRVVSGDRRTYFQGPVFRSNTAPNAAFAGSFLTDQVTNEKKITFNLAISDPEKDAIFSLYYANSASGCSDGDLSAWTNIAADKKMNWNGQ